MQEYFITLTFSIPFQIIKDVKTVLKLKYVHNDSNLVFLYIYIILALIKITPPFQHHAVNKKNPYNYL